MKFRRRRQDHRPNGAPILPIYTVAPNKEATK